MVRTAEGGNYRRSGLLSRAQIYLSCLVLTLAACVSLALDSVNVAPSTHLTQPTTAHEPDRPELIADYKMLDFVRTRLPSPSSKIHASLYKTLLNGRFTLSFLVDLFSRCAESDLAFCEKPRLGTQS